jgi:hydroxymethylglutaryl-CoA lyase
MAVANALTAWQEYGISGFDASTGGVGGCPYAPGAGGNVAMEDLAFAFQASGAKIAVDIQKLQDAASLIEPHLGHPMPSRLSKVSLSPKS